MDFYFNTDSKFRFIAILTRLQSMYTIANTRFFTSDLDLGVIVTQNVAEYPPHHATHEPGKFEVATSNG